MQCKALCYLGKYTLPIHFAEKVICKRMSMNSDHYMNSEMEETTMNSAWEGLGLASTKEWMGFSTWQGEQASRGEEHAVAESPEPRSQMKVRRQRWGLMRRGCQYSLSALKVEVNTPLKEDQSIVFGKSF